MERAQADAAVKAIVLAWFRLHLMGDETVRVPAPPIAQAVLAAALSRQPAPVD